MKLASAIIVKNYDTIIGLYCAKGRGLILPGGKLEHGETLKDAAVRELYEETGLSTFHSNVKYIWHGPCLDGFTVFSFLTTNYAGHPKDTTEGTPVWTTPNRILQSSCTELKSYYECLFDVMRDKGIIT